MQTPGFQQGLQEFIDVAQRAPTAIMCAEAVPWRCHRSLIADAVIVRGWRVLEILSDQEPKPHELPAWAMVENGVVTYPGEKAPSHGEGTRLGAFGDGGCKKG